jgi:tripartite-type tricarboxylate transporter receptor subunit TctC
LHVPNLLSFVNDDLDRKAVSLVTSQQIFSRPYVTPPGVPAQQAQILRDAFAAVLRDPKFLADAAATRLNIAPVSGERLHQVVAQLYGTSGDVVERARQLIASPDVRK